MAGKASAGPYFLFPDRTNAHRRSLRILQWRHPVPAYDQWFDEVFSREWGQRNDTTVLVDRVPPESIHSQARAEVAAGRGHDLCLFLSPPAIYEEHVIDHHEIYDQAQARHGSVIPLGHRSTFNPVTKKYFAFCDSYMPAPVAWRRDLWTQIGLPLGPTDYDVLRTAARQIRDQCGIPGGLGLAEELSSNVALHGLLWSFGGNLFDDGGGVAIRSNGTLEALKYMRALYRESEAEAVFKTQALANGRSLLEGAASFIVHAISVARRAELQDRVMAGRIMFSPGLKGPSDWLACPHITQCYSIWSFAHNKAGAKRFLADLIDSSRTAFEVSGFCNFPSFPSTVPNLLARLSNDSRADPHWKYTALRDALHWTTNIGHPGYATAAADEVFRRFVIPRMFARVARGKLKPEESVAAAEHEVRRILNKHAL